MSRILSVVDCVNAESRPSFFAEQFAVGRTTGQRVFDVVFGVAAPILCFFADPVVFRAGGFALGGEAVLGGYQLFAYLVSAVAITVLIIWLLLEDHLQSYGSVIGGVFIGGALFSTAVGVIILPFSLFGLIFLIGLAGFTPFLTGFVYLRNGVKAFRRSRKTRLELKAAGAVLAASIAIGLPAIISYKVDLIVAQSVDALLNGDAAHAEAAVARLRWMPFIPDRSLDSLAFAYAREQDAKKKEVLKKYYRDVTGEDIDWRLRVLND